MTNIFTQSTITLIFFILSFTVTTHASGPVVSPTTQIQTKTPLLTLPFGSSPISLRTAINELSKIKHFEIKGSSIEDEQVMLNFSQNEETDAILKRLLKGYNFVFINSDKPSTKSVLIILGKSSRSASVDTPPPPVYNPPPPPMQTTQPVHTMQQPAVNNQAAASMGHRNRKGSANDNLESGQPPQQAHTAEQTMQQHIPIEYGIVAPSKPIATNTPSTSISMPIAASPAVQALIPPSPPPTATVDTPPAPPPSVVAAVAGISMVDTQPAMLTTTESTSSTPPPQIPTTATDTGQKQQEPVKIDINDLRPPSIPF